MADPVEKKYDYDMSMEDILSSIRKYVSDEDDKKSDKNESLDQNMNFEDVFINLDESQIASDDEAEEDCFDESRQREEHSSHSQNIEREPVVNHVVEPQHASSAQNAQKKVSGSAFNKLADALKSYGKNDVQKEEKSFLKNKDVTMTQFLTAVSGKIIEDWAEKNLRKIVEEIIVREIEKIKSE